MIVFVSPGILEMPLSNYGGIEKVIQSLSKGFRLSGLETKILSPLGVKETNNHEYHHCDKASFIEDVREFLYQNKAMIQCVFLNHVNQRPLLNDIKRLQLQYFEIGHCRNFASNKNRIYPSRALRMMAPTAYRSYIISHPIDFSEHKRVTKPNFQLDLPDKFISTTSRIYPYKRTDLAVEYAKMLGLPLVVAGPQLTDADKAYAAKFIDRTIYMGSVDTSAISEINSRTQMSMCLSKPFPFEAFGLFQAEAYAVGAKVFTAATGALGEYTIPWATEKHSIIPSIAQKRLNRLLNKTVDAREISSIAHKKFSIEATVKRYLSLMDN